MKWYKLMLGLLGAGFLIYLFHSYPFVWPLLVNHPHGWLRVLLTDMVKIGSAGGGPNPWVILGFLGTILLVARLSLVLRPSTRHGSARFAPWREVGRFAVPGMPSKALSFLARVVVLPCVLIWTLITVGRDAAILRSRLLLHAARVPYFVIGKYHWRTIALREKQQQEHLLILAPTGAGKSRLLMIPNLLVEPGTRSLFIADLKDDELYSLTAGAVARHHQIKVFAPLKPQSSNSYNPLAHINSVADAQDFAECWVHNTGLSKEEFWLTSSKLLITAVVLHLRDIEPNVPFSRLSDILTGSAKTIKQILATTPSIDAQRVGKEFLGKMEDNERLIASVLSDLGNRFQILADPNVRTVTETNEIDFNAMNDEVIAFYLCVPRKATRRLKPLLATLTMQLFTAWEGRGTYSKACYLDEFTKLGHIPGMADFLSMARHYRIAVIMAIQNFA